MAGAVVEGSAANPVPEAGNDTARNITTINENALFLGIVARPIDALRITGDFEFGYNDQSFTRIDPRQVQSYKIHATYKPRPWANLAGAVEIHDNRDNVTTVNNIEHDRSYSFSAMLMPNQHLSVDFGFNYWNVYTQSLICFAYSTSSANPAPPPATLPVSTFPPGRARAVHGYGVPDCRVAFTAGRAFHLRQQRLFRSRRCNVEANEAGNGGGGLWRAALFAGTRFF